VSFWLLLLLTLGVLWLLQMVGTYFQMQHYRKVLGGITREGGKGYVRVGNAKARLGRGVILILVVGEDNVVRKALRMRGMTVFARFEEAPDLVGHMLDDLRDEGREGPYEKATILAAQRAVEQIDRIKAEREVEAGVG
jgi:glucitol operon activator protein